MTFKERMNDHTTVLRLGMTSLIVFSLLHFVRPASDSWVDLVDGVRGLFLGLSIGFNLWSVRLSKGRRCTTEGRTGGEE